MATTFPLPLSRFSDTLRVTSMSLHCPAVTEDSETAGGEVLSALLGAYLWRGTITLAPAIRHVATGSPAAASAPLRALLDLLQQPGASFMLSPHDYSLGVPGLAITLESVAANNRDIVLGGLQPGQIVQAGAYLSFDYAASPVRHAFHQVLTGGTASAGGTVAIEVTAPLRAGWATGANVNLALPRFKARMRQVSPGVSGLVVHDDMSFDFIQILR